MNFVGHLSELRNRLMITGISFVLFFIVGFIFVEEIYFFFESDLDFKLTITSPVDIIWVYFTIAGIIAFVCTLPVLSLQLWLFIKPCLTKSERRVSLSYIPVVFLLFVFFLFFVYFIFIKLIFSFI